MLVVKSCVELLRLCGINTLVVVSDTPAFRLRDHKLPTTKNIRTCNRSVCEENLDESFERLSSRFILKKLDYSLSIPIAG